MDLEHLTVDEMKKLLKQELGEKYHLVEDLSDAIVEEIFEWFNKHTNYSPSSGEAPKLPIRADGKSWEQEK